MPNVATFRCECGACLSVVTDSTPREFITIPCPGPSCRLRHFMSGRVLEVFVLTEDGQSSNYDWKAREAQNASLKSRQHRSVGQ